MHLKLFGLLFLITIANCQTQRVECDEKKVDKCYSNFLLLCNNTIKFPETLKELKQWCSNHRPVINKCIKDYVLKCVDSKLMQINLDLQRRALNNYYKSVCTSDINTNRRLSLAKCWNSLKPAFLRSCHYVFYDQMAELIKMPKNRKKLASLCCFYWEFINCGVKLIRKVAAKGSPICDYGHAIEFDSINKYVSEVLSTRCAREDSTPQSENCVRVVSSAIRVRHPEEYYKHQSAIPLLMEVYNTI